MTTAAPARWWAPVAPGIGPDEFDLQLLTPGGDPAKDLGQTLLALHRVGAAACEAVATQPLHDEVTLRGVLAATRQLLAAPATTAVSKSFEGAYGPLLLADLLDGAEAAAVSIYRTCITKSCAPSVAARRAGLIYGVPLRELGRYAGIATEPKTPDRTVEELADRTLMSFVGKVLEEEAPEGAKQLVSKAPARERENNDVQTAMLQSLFDQAQTKDDPATPYHDARDRKGQFARESAPAEVGTVKPTPTLSRPNLKRANIQRANVTRASATPAQTSRVPVGRESVGRDGVGRQKVGRVKLSREAVRLQQILAQEAGDEAQIFIPPVAAGGGGRGDEVDGLARTGRGNGNTPKRPLVGTRVFLFAGPEWRNVVSGMGSLTDTNSGIKVHHFRQHLLRDGGPVDLEDASTTHQARRHVMAIVDNHPDHKNQPRAVPIVVPDGAHLVVDRDELARFKNQLLDQLENQLGPMDRARELSFIHVAAGADNPDDLVVFWQPPTPGKGKFDRPLRTITEVVAEDEVLDGHDGGGGTQWADDIELDPDQPLLAAGARRFFRDGYLVKEVMLARSNDATVDQLAKSKQRKTRFGKGLVAFGKVAERERADTSGLQALFDQAESDYLASRNVQNDEQTGRFERRGGGLMRSNVSRPNLQRSNVTPRLLGRGTVGRETTGREGAGRETVGRESVRMERVALEQAALATAKDSRREDLVYLDDGFKYVVLDTDDVTTLMEEHGFVSVDRAEAEPFTTGFGTHAMLNDDRMHAAVDEARLKLLYDTDERFTRVPFDKDAPLWKQAVRATINDESDLSGVALDLEDWLFKHPEVQMVRAVMVPRPSGGKSVIITGNGTPIHLAGHLVRIEPGVAPRTLRPEGKRRLTGAAGLEYWLKMRYSGGRSLGGEFTDQLPVPLVFTWAATD